MISFTHSLFYRIIDNETEFMYDSSELQFVSGQRGSKLLSIDGYNYVKNRATNEKLYWICCRKHSAKCNARVITEITKLSPDEKTIFISVISKCGIHTHEIDPKAAKRLQADSNQPIDVD